MTGRCLRLVAAVLTVSLASVPAAAGPRRLAKGLDVTNAAVDVALALGLARIGVARPELTKPVRFAGTDPIPPASGALIRGGFGLGAYSVTSDQAVGGNANVRLVRGLLGHEDLFGRTEWSTFTSGIVVQSRTTVVQASHLEAYHPPQPTVRFAFVPVADAPKKLLDGRYTSPSLLRFLYEAASVPADGLAPGEYHVFALFMDRLHEKTKVRLVVADRAEGEKGQGRGSVVASDAGWFAVGRKLRIEPGTPRYLKAVVQAPGTKATLASSLSTADLLK